MIHFEDTKLKGLAVHFVGNKIQEEALKVSSALLELDPDINSLLKKYFTRFFKDQPFYQFHHESDLSFNECHQFVKEIFQEESSLYINSVKLAKHLYSVCDHPNIKSGEFYVAYFDQVYVGDEICEAMGVFKSENKETYLKVYPEEQNFTIEQGQGVNINKLDKGCLILNMAPEEGYKVMVIDNTNRQDAAQYWTDKFLKIKPVEDNYYHTQHYMNMCRDFALEVFPESSMADKLAMAQESLKYFNKQETFDKLSFQEETLRNPEIIDAFEEYKIRYQEERSITIADEFEVAPAAVKQLKKVFKSVIKLDKNFHIYIHGNHDYIQKGVDPESGMNYYQLFFKEEH